MSTPRRLRKAGDKPGKPTGRWQARIAMRKNGKSVQVGIGTFATKRDALDAQLHELAKLRAGTFITASDRKMRFEVWAEQWYAARKAPSAKVRSFLDARILPAWHDASLEDIRSGGIETWVRDLSADLAPASVQGIYTVMKAICQAAVDHDPPLLVRNPCRMKAGSLPTVRRTDVVFLTESQTATLLALAPDRYKAFVYLAVWSGLRWGEMAALRWEHLDLKAGIVHVLTAVKRDGTIGLPKGDKTRRVIVEPDVVDWLRQHRRDFGQHDFVFATKGGQRLNYANFRRGVWLPLVASSLFDPKPTCHDTRHTYASLMIAAGTDWLILANQMGHHKPSLTMDIYGHLRHDAEDATRAALVRARAMRKASLEQVGMKVGMSPDGP